MTATLGDSERYPTRRTYVGLRIARLRDMAKLTQQMLADRVGVSREYVSMIENGRRDLARYPLIRAFAAALAVEVPVLVEPYDTSEMPVPPATDGPVLDLRSVRAHVRRGPSGDLRIVVSQGSVTVEFSAGTGMTGSDPAGVEPDAMRLARQGAHRLADAAFRYTLGREDPDSRESPDSQESPDSRESPDSGEDSQRG